jgi:hypothetical protein
VGHINFSFSKMRGIERLGDCKIDARTLATFAADAEVLVRPEDFFNAEDVALKFDAQFRIIGPVGMGSRRPKAK